MLSGLTLRLSSDLEDSHRLTLIIAASRQSTLLSLSPPKDYSLGRERDAAKKVFQQQSFVRIDCCCSGCREERI